MLRNMLDAKPDRTTAPIIHGEPLQAGAGVEQFRLLSTSVADRDITVYYTVYGCLCVATVLIDVEQHRRGSFDYPTVTSADLDGAEDAWVCEVAMNAWRAEPDAVMARLCGGRARRETAQTVRDVRRFTMADATENLRAGVSK